MVGYPVTLNQSEDRFSDEEFCLNYLFQIRWPKGFVCPACQGKNAWKTKRGLWSCASCGHQTSVTSGTIFHKTRKPLTVWFRVIWDMAMLKNGISAKSVKERLGFRSYQTAWVWLQKLRKTMVHADRERLSGTVLVHEFYWNGNKPGKEGIGASGNVIIAVAVEGISLRRNGRIRIKKIESSSWKDWRKFITEAVEPNSVILTDCSSSYCGIEIQNYRSKITESQNLNSSHLIASSLKRWISETHKGAVRSSHLASYLDEFTFRYNHRPRVFKGNAFLRIMQNAVIAAPTPLKRLKFPR
jgi:transposase-like protein